MLLGLSFGYSEFSLRPPSEIGSTLQNFAYSSPKWHLVVLFFSGVIYSNGHCVFQLRLGHFAVYVAADSLLTSGPAAWVYSSTAPELLCLSARARRSSFFMVAATTPIVSATWRRTVSRLCMRCNLCWTGGGDSGRYGTWMKSLPSTRLWPVTLSRNGQIGPFMTPTGESMSSGLKRRCGFNLCWISTRPPLNSSAL